VIAPQVPLGILWMPVFAIMKIRSAMDQWRTGKVKITRIVAIEMTAGYRLDVSTPCAC